METKNMIERIWKSSVGKKIEAEEASSLLSKRREAVAVIKQLHADGLSSAKRLSREKEVAEAGVKEAHENFLAAQRKLAGAQMKIMSASTVSTSERGKHERFLRESADPKIQEFISALRDLQHVVRRDGVESWSEFKKTRNLDTKEIHFSNSGEVNAWLDTTKEAIDKAEGLKFETIEPPKMTERLNKLREMISESRAATVYINNRQAFSTGDALQVQASV